VPAGTKRSCAGDRARRRRGAGCWLEGPARVLDEGKKEESGVCRRRVQALRECEREEEWGDWLWLADFESGTVSSSAWRLRRREEEGSFGFFALDLRGWRIGEGGSSSSLGDVAEVIGREDEVVEVVEVCRFSRASSSA
jgi:hypothetical protein